MRPFLIVALLLAVATLSFAADNPIPNASFEELDGAGWAKDWGKYQWGLEDAKGEQRIDTTVAHTGKNSLMGINLDSGAKAGAYCHVPLAAGAWALSFWAKAASGKQALVRCYLASAYSRSYEVGDQWTKITFRNTLLNPIDRAEINVQNNSGEISTVWFDDVSLEPTELTAYKIVRDTRPLSKQPKLLYFDAHLMSWADHAAEWKARGFSGAFISGIFGDIHDDPWGADKDPATRGEDDKLLQECKAANDKCLKAGIDSNVLKVAMYRDFPNPFDDEGWALITKNFIEAGRFARLAHFPCLALDAEYTAYQFDPSWKGYDLTQHSAKELGAKMQERWAKITSGIVKEYPAVDLLTLPEGSIHYGPLWSSMFAGMIDGLIAVKYDRGIHLFTESSYQMRDPMALSEFALDVKETTARKLPEPARKYWLSKCSVALGVWPLGYYRAISGKDGKFLGWSGKVEKFGDKIVGSYADKSENYPVSEFRPQMAAARTFSGKYAWVYSHGMSWWQMTPEEAAKYKATSLQPFSAETYQLPTVPNIEEYYKISGAREVVKMGK
jgi:hypothetical protein